MKYLSKNSPLFKENMQNYSLRRRNVIAINELEKLAKSKYDEDYTELLSMDGLYMVKGLTCNIWKKNL